MIRVTKNLTFLIFLLSFSVGGQDSSTAEAHLKRGDGLLQSQKYQEAIAEFKASIRTNPQSAEAHFKLGLAYSAIPISDQGASDNFNAAFKAFKKAVRLKPDWAEAHNQLGRKYNSLLQYDDAIKSLTEAIRLKPELDEAHKNLGIAYLYTGQFQDAIERLKEAIRIDPNKPLPHKLLGLAYLATYERENAMDQYVILKTLDKEMAEDLNKALQNPDNPVFGVTRGRALTIPKPEYAASAKGISGKVIVEVTIDEDGKVTAARAIEGPIELRLAAETAARKARFEPTKLSGKPISTKGVLTYNFVAQ